MDIYPLKNLSVEEAINLQFKLVDIITKVFPGNEVLNRGDLGVINGLNKPITTHKVEKVIAEFFDSESAMLVRGAGTNSIRLSLYSGVGTNNKLLIHEAPIYPTTKVSIDMLGIQTIEANFNISEEVIKKLKEEKPQGILIQTTRQKISDSYDLKELIRAIRLVDSTIPIITDDNYSAMKTKKIGSQLGATLSCFSTFKLLGPEGVGCIVGKEKYIKKLQKQNYSGGGQVQGHEALDVIQGMIYAPVSLAISANVSNEVSERLNSGEIEEIEEAFVVNAQSRVVIVKLKNKLSHSIIAEATKLGALPNPVGAESKYEYSPLIYKVSGTFRADDPNAMSTMLRINPNRSGADTIIEILKESIRRVKK